MKKKQSEASLDRCYYFISLAKWAQVLVYFYDFLSLLKVIIFTRATRSI